MSGPESFGIAHALESLRQGIQTEHERIARRVTWHVASQAPLPTGDLAPGLPKQESET